MTQFPVEYKGFSIDEKFRILKDGREVFAAYYQKAYNLEDAKLTIDMSNIAKEVCKGKRITVAPAVVHDLDFDEIERETEAAKVDQYWDRQNDEHWK